MTKLQALLGSRKFWALVISLTAIWTAVANGAMTVTDAINATVAALGLYSVGTGLDNPQSAG